MLVAVPEYATTTFSALPVAPVRETTNVPVSPGVSFAYGSVAATLTCGSVVSLSWSVMIARLGPPAMKLAFEASWRITVSGPSALASSTGTTFTTSDAWPAGMVNVLNEPSSVIAGLKV